MALDNVPLSMVERFAILEDQRAGYAKRHELVDIIVITLYAVICSAVSCSPFPSPAIGYQP